MHQTFDREQAQVTKLAFARLTRKARRMAKSHSKKRSAKPAQVQDGKALPQTSTYAAPDSLPNNWSCSATINQKCAQLEMQRLIVENASFRSSTFWCPIGLAADRSSMQQNIFSGIPALQHCPPSASASLTPHMILPSRCALPPPLGPTTFLPTAFLLGAAWAAAAAKPLASYALPASRF